MFVCIVIASVLLYCVWYKKQEEEKNTNHGQKLRRKIAIFYPFQVCVFFYALISSFYTPLQYAFLSSLSDTPPLGGRGALAEILQGRTQGL